MSESDADKKRNKLGYQRISVACGHCRRRKIRCVMAEGDAQNRCQNCIRLQKQCVFYPVDQQLPSEKAGSSSSRANATPTLPSSTSHSPQEMTAGRPFDQGEFPQVTPVPSNAPQGYPGVAYEAAAQGIEYSYRPADYSQQWSAASDSSTNIALAMPGAGLGFAVGGYAPYVASTDSLQPTPTDARSYSFSGPADRSWSTFPQPLTRAMSYGQFEGMQTTHVQTPPVYAQMQPQSLPHLDMRSIHLQQQIGGPQSAPPVVPMQQQQQQQFNPGTYAYEAQSAPPGWYAGQPYDPYDGNAGTDQPARSTQR